MSIAANAAHCFSELRVKGGTPARGSIRMHKEDAVVNKSQVTL